MEWKRATKPEVKRYVDRMNDDSQYFEDNLESLLHPEPPEEYAEIHDRIRARYDECCRKKESGGYAGHRSPEYGIDLDMAREIYTVMHEAGLSQRDASDDGVWLYINRYVVPDVVYLRFRSDKKDAKRLVPDRFYDNSRRFYPKMLWWYIHISWQEVDESWMRCLDATVEMLSGNQSDDISQLIERPGEGYPLRVYNEIMRQYATELQGGARMDGLLSKVLKLNIIRMESVEPELVSGGIESYVNGLYREVLGDDGRALRRGVRIFPGRGRLTFDQQDTVPRETDVGRVRGLPILQRGSDGGGDPGIRLRGVQGVLRERRAGACLHTHQGRSAGVPQVELPHGFRLHDRTVLAAVLLVPGLLRRQAGAHSRRSGRVVRGLEGGSWQQGLRQGGVPRPGRVVAGEGSAVQGLHGRMDRPGAWG